MDLPTLSTCNVPIRYITNVPIRYIIRYIATGTCVTDRCCSSSLRHNCPHYNGESQNTSWESYRIKLSWHDLICTIIDYASRALVTERGKISERICNATRNLSCPIHQLLLNRKNMVPKPKQHITRPMPYMCGINSYSLYHHMSIYSDSFAGRTVRIIT